MRRTLFLGLAMLSLTMTASAETPLASIRAYIDHGWTTLSRDHRQLLEAAADTKTGQGERATLYVAQDEDADAIRARLARELPAAELAHLELRTLPAPVDHPGLLYLPEPYVVPGGRFNEMYGWDSYFIVLGLLRDHHVDQARQMVDNFVYEVRHYGKILNANRSYYLTRSQPPFLTEMVLAVYAQTHDRAWLEGTVPAIESTWALWMREPRITATGLSRYCDEGHGPAPEVLTGDRDAQGRNHFQRIQEFYRTHTITDYDLSMYYDRAHDQLTDLFYLGDRTMRESGFDPSDRFGNFNIDVIHYNPVCLNSLLYRMEIETGQIMKLLGRPDQLWLERAARRRDLVVKYLWDPQDHTFLDYNFQTGKRRHYPFATTFFPLWAGLATPEQAAGVEKQVAVLEAPGGLMTSTNESGSQWDKPFGWAPLQLIAVDGLRRYGYAEDADRISIKWLGLVLKELMAHGTIVEKYDVVARRSQLGENALKFGYTTNEVGFGWTNGGFLEMLEALSPGGQQRVVDNALNH